MLRVVLVFVVLCVFGDGGLSGRGLFCRDPETGQLHPVNSTWPASSFCGTYHCKIRRKNITSTEYAPMRQINITEIQRLGQNATIVDIHKGEGFVKKENVLKNTATTHNKTIPYAIDSDTLKEIQGLKLIDDINETNAPDKDRYLSEKEIRSLTEILHTVRKSDLDAIVEIYNLAQDMYKELDQTSTDLILQETLSTVKTLNQQTGKSRLFKNLTKHNIASYWYEPLSNTKTRVDLGPPETLRNDISPEIPAMVMSIKALAANVANVTSNATTNILLSRLPPVLPTAKPANSKTQEEREKFFNTPLSRNDFGKLPYYYPMSYFQRMSSYKHEQKKRLFDDISIQVHPLAPERTTTPAPRPSWKPKHVPAMLSLPEFMPAHTQPWAPEYISARMPESMPEHKQAHILARIPARILEPIPENTQARILAKIPAPIQEYKQTRIPARIPPWILEYIPVRLLEPLPENTQARLPSKKPARKPTPIPEHKQARIPARIPARILEYIPSSIMKSMPAQIQGGNPARIPDPLPEHKQARIPARIPARVLEYIPSRIIKSMPAQTQGGNPARIPDHIAEHTQAHLLAKVPEPIPQNTHARIPGKIPELIPGPIPVRISSRVASIPIQVPLEATTSLPASISAPKKAHISLKNKPVNTGSKYPKEFRPSIFLPNPFIGLQQRKNWVLTQTLYGGNNFGHSFPNKRTITTDDNDNGDKGNDIPPIKRLKGKQANAVLINLDLENSKDLQIAASMKTEDVVTTKHKQNEEHRPFERRKPAWQTDPIPKHVLDEVRANIQQENHKAYIRTVPFRKRVKLERVGKLLNIDELIRSKRETNVTNTTTEEVLEPEIFEVFIEKTTCDNDYSKPGFFRFGNVTEPYPKCCPQRIPVR